ncbi:MAG: hypothetical protein NTX42_08005 [Methanothrix sp.]|nr:hypothetical protein [Methanothrix sp.]
MAIVPLRIRTPRKHLIKSNMADARALQLEAAKQILAEVFHTRRCDVEDMIIRRLKEKCRPEEKSRIMEHRSSAKWGRWPEMFMIEEEIKI